MLFRTNSEREGPRETTVEVQRRLAASFWMSQREVELCVGFLRRGLAKLGERSAETKGAQSPLYG